MLPLDPPLSKGARPGFMHPGRPFDDRALARLDADPDNPARQAAFARHVLARDPENVWAMMVLAYHAKTKFEQVVLLREAVRVGFRGWEPSLSGREPAPDWGRDRESNPFMGSVLAYGMALFETGHAEEAATCLRFMPDLDPEDTFEVSAAMAQVGLVSPSGAAGNRNG